MTTISKHLKKIIVVLIFLLVIFLLYFYFFNNTIKEYETTTVTLGDIRNTISTSGKLKAVITVDVGAQISGQISDLRADFNTLVKKGQLLARIDPRSFESQVRQAEANLSVAKANLKMQIANKERSEYELESSFANYENRKSSADESKRRKPVVASVPDSIVTLPPVVGATKLP